MQSQRQTSPVHTRELVEFRGWIAGLDVGAQPPGTTARGNTGKRKRWETTQQECKRVETVGGMKRTDHRALSWVHPIIALKGEEDGQTPPTDKTPRHGVRRLGRSEVRMCPQRQETPNHR